MKKIFSASLILLLGFYPAIVAFTFEYSHPEDKDDSKGAREDAPSEADASSKRSEQTNEYEISAACVQQDLVGKFLDGWTFDERTMCRIKILNAKYRRNAAVLNVSMKAVKHIRQNPGWIGKQGELQLVYAHHNNKWNLLNVETTAFFKLSLAR